MYFVVMTTPPSSAPLKQYIWESFVFSFFAYHKSPELNRNTVFRHSIKWKIILASAMHIESTAHFVVLKIIS